MKLFRAFAALAALLILLGAPVSGALAQQQPPQLVDFKPGVVTVVTASGSHKFTVELAIDQAQREQGLMFRKSLGKDAGMLFLYPSPQPIAVWMKNTFIPLDILFIGTDGTITSLHERAVPMTTTTISSEGLAKAFLELNGGTASRLGIKVGDKIQGEGLGN